jgi:hypothetical protein
MATSTTTNTDLEQALFKAALREKKLRNRAALAIAMPVVCGGIWLLFSAYEVVRWEARSNEIEQREAGVVQREADAKKQIAEADAHRVEAEATAKSSQAHEAAAKQKADDIQKRLIKVRDEIGGLGTLLTDITSARAKASKLMASEALETQLMEIRGGLGHTLGRIEQAIDTALPASEQKARVYIYIADDSQRDSANALKADLEGNGFDVGAIAKNTGTRKIDSTEIRYFREQQDKADAGRILAIVEKQTGQGGAKMISASDPDFAGGSSKFQVWLAKLPAVAQPR